MAKIDHNFLLNECVAKLVEAKKNNFFNTKPYKHIVVDNFFNSKIADDALKAFSIINEKDWDVSNDKDIEIKMRSKWISEFDIPESILPCVRILNSSIFLDCLSNIFDIKGVLMDPYFSGGGLNITPKDGLLDVHVDGNFHDKTGMHRRLNAILYLNKGWEKKWKGELGLYDRSGERCLKKIEPIFNRLFIFQTDDYSFHGLPDPIEFPRGEYRKSLILYYYTVGSRTESEKITEKPHSALWKKRGLKDKKGNLTREIYDEFKR